MIVLTNRLAISADESIKCEDFEKFLKLVPDVPAQSGDEHFWTSTGSDAGTAINAE